MSEIAESSASTEEPAPTDNTTDKQEWWTDQRCKIWEQIDAATTEVATLCDPDHYIPGGLSIHACGPNSQGINATNTPDEWYVSLPYAGEVIDAEAVAALLSEELEVPVTVRPRSEEWEPGYWLLIDDAEQELAPEENDDDDEA
jgi:hypothetical protein